LSSIFNSQSFMLLISLIFRLYAFVLVAEFAA
jgi:hypothetical protein